MAFPVLMAVFAAASAISGVAGAMQGKESIQEQKRAQRQQTALEVEKNKKAAIQTIREARIRRAAIENSAVVNEAQGTGALGSTGSIATQSAVSRGFQNIEAQNAMNITKTLGRGAQHQGKALGWQASQGAFGNLFSYTSQL